MKFFKKVSIFFLRLIAKLFIPDYTERYRLQVATPGVLGDNQKSLKEFAEGYFTGQYWYCRSSHSLQRMSIVHEILARFAEPSSPILNLDLSDKSNAWRNLELLRIIEEEERMIKQDDPQLYFRVHGMTGSRLESAMLRIVIEDKACVARMMLSDWSYDYGIVFMGGLHSSRIRIV